MILWGCYPKPDWYNIEEGRVIRIYAFCLKIVPNVEFNLVRSRYEFVFRCYRVITPTVTICGLLGNQFLDVL